MSNGYPSVLVFLADSDDLRTTNVEGLDVEVAPISALTSPDLDFGDEGVECIVVEIGHDAASVAAVVEDVREAFPDSRIVVATGERGDEATDRALELGVDEVIRGRVSDRSPAVVTHRVESALGDARSDQRCRAPIEERARILDSAVDELDDVFFVVDDHGRLVAWNETTAERFGYSDAELDGINGREMFPEDQWDEGTGPDPSTRKDPDRIRTLDMLTSDGERIPHEFNSVWFEDEVTGETYRVGVARDVSDRREYERQLHRRHDRLGDFIESLAEDVRDSIEIGRGALEMARNEDERSFEAVDRTLEEVEGTLDEIDGLLDDALELAEQGQAVVDPAVISLSTAVSAAWDDVTARDATLVVDDLGSSRVECDPARLRRLLTELLQNGIRHSRPLSPGVAEDPDSRRTDTVASDDGVTIRVGRVDDGFFVADDGRGIPAPERELVFEPGYSTRDGDDGVGLAIVAEIATAHGWDVSVDAPQTGGARFRVRGVEFVDEPS